MVSMKKVMLGYIVVFCVIAIIVFFASDQDPMAVLGVAVAGALGFVIYAGQLRSAWTGVVEDLYEKTTHDNENGTSTTHTMARIRLENGRKKKIRAYPTWRVGDRLVKNRGEADIKVVPD